jgi:hypothetical protein
MALAEEGVVDVVGDEEETCAETGECIVVPKGYHLRYFHPKLKLRLITSPTSHTGIGVQYVWQRVERTTLILPIGRRSGQYLF